MLGIEVKYLGVTVRRGARLKISVEGYKSEVVSRDFSYDLFDQVLLCAVNYASRFNLGELIGMCSFRDHYVGMVEGSGVTSSDKLRVVEFERDLARLRRVAA